MLKQEQTSGTSRSFMMPTRVMIGLRQPAAPCTAAKGRLLASNATHGYQPLGPKLQKLQVAR